MRESASPTAPTRHGTDQTTNQADWETAERGARAIDPSKEAVDGGRFPEPLTEPQIASRKRLVEAQRELGRRLTRVLEAVVIHGMTMEQIAQSESQSLIKMQGNLFRTALNELAIFYGLSNSRVQYAAPYHRGKENAYPEN